MDFREIKELVEIINSSDLAYFEFKTKDGYLKLDKSLTRNSEIKNVSSEELLPQVGKEVIEVENNADEIRKKEDHNELDGLINITAPMVGTFYGSPAPDKDSFVKEGDIVHKGKVLCIVEAMKLMNEIECEYDCKIVEILVKDGDMVEFGQPIFSIRRI